MSEDKERMKRFLMESIELVARENFDVNREHGLALAIIQVLASKDLRLKAVEMAKVRYEGDAKNGTRKEEKGD